MKRVILPMVVVGMLGVSMFSPRALAQAAGKAEGFSTAGAIESVTVYRGQALVTRIAEIPAGKGTTEIVLTDLPARIQPASLHAESEDLQVRSVRFRTRPVAQDIREEVRAIDATIADLEQKITANHRKSELINENKAYLASLQQFVAPTATTEMTRGVLNAETIEKLTTFILKQRETFANTELALAAEGKKLQSDMELAQRERQKITAGSQKTAHEAVVLVAREGAGAGTLRLRYLVDNATWTPSYNVRTESPAGKQRDSVTLDYYASVAQMSGEDWGNVTMTLSTATPSLVAKAPTLTPMNVALGGTPAPVQTMQLDAGYFRAREELSKKQKEFEQQRQNKAGGPAGGQRGGGKDDFRDAEFDKSLNENAANIQVLDLVASEKVERKTRGQQPASEEGLSVTYTISGRTSLPSRSDRQLIQIASLPMQAEFTKLATPVLTGYVYDEARSTNSSTIVLLAGPVTGYSDGAFVGSGELPTVASGESFNVGFGIDSALRTSREVVERTETIQGGNRVVELTYRINVENFAGVPATVRLLDRLPKTTDSQIKITLLSTGAEMSDAEDYVNGAKKEGILRWDVTVPAQAVGTKAFGVEYKFRLEYDKQMSLVGLGG